jgi:hypothetical protein
VNKFLHGKLVNSQGWSINSVISGFRIEVGKNCALLCYYAAIGGYFLPTFQDNLLGSFFKDQEKPKGNKNNDTWCCFTFDLLQE